MTIVQKIFLQKSALTIIVLERTVLLTPPMNMEMFWILGLNYTIYSKTQHRFFKIKLKKKVFIENSKLDEMLKNIIWRMSGPKKNSNK